jgi:hypothetical protein
MQQRYDIIECNTHDNIYYILDDDTGVIVRTTDDADIARSVAHDLNTNGDNFQLETV